MISPITWLWNIRHRKLIEETKAIINLSLFLKEIGLKEDLPFKELKQLLLVLNRSIIRSKPQRNDNEKWIR